MVTVYDLSMELANSMRAQLSECQEKDLVAHVLICVCRALDVQLTALKSPKRDIDLAEARFIIMHILVKHQKLTTTRVGKLLNRDHATVIYGIDKYQSRLDAKDKAFRHKINLVMEELGAL